MSVLYIVVCRLLELIVLFGRGDRAKELEILVLRHELSILRRQAGQPRFEAHDRVLLAAFSRMLPRRAWKAFLVRPETLLHWHRRLVARRWTYPHRRPGRPPLSTEVRELILSLARENAGWGYQRIVGELRKLGIGVSATSVRNILAGAGVPPAPRRGVQSWRSFLRAYGESILACDFFTVDTVWLRRLYMLVFLSIGSRRIEYFACTSKPDTEWMLQQARNLLMELDDRGRQVRFLIHDRDAKFPRTFDALLATEDIKVIRTPVRAPNANAHMERWVGSVRRECLDRLLIVGRRQLEHVLRVYVKHYNRQRPHRALDLKPPDPSPPSSVAADSQPAGSSRASARPPRRPHPRIRTRRSVTIEFLHPTGWHEHEAEVVRRRREQAELDRSLYRQALRLEEHDDPAHPVVALAKRRIVELTAERDRFRRDLASLEAQPPSDVHPDAVEAMLAAVPDLSDALDDYAPPELAQLFEDFDVEATYNKHERTLQLAATLALDTPPETARPPRGRSHNCDIAGARYDPISDPCIPVESLVEWRP